MPARSGRSGPQGPREGRITGTSAKPTTQQNIAAILTEGAAGGVSELSFMRGFDTASSAFRTAERRALMEGSLYVGDWRDWVTPWGETRRIDYGCMRFLRDCIRTFIEARKNDEKETGSPIRALPQPDGSGHGYFEALCFIAALWQTEDILALPKSRRMIISWLLRSLDTWDVLYHPGRQLYVVGDDLADAEKMVYRNFFQLRAIPNERVPSNVLPPVTTVTAKDTAGVGNMYNRVTVRHSEHENGALDSFIQALGQSDDGRGDGAARITLEEFPQWKRARKVWTGLRGTMVGESKEGEISGGQIVMVGTAVANVFMADLVLDKVGTKDK